MIQRTFKDVAKGELEKASARDYLIEFGYGKALDWGKLLKSKRVLIISEAGAGKTYECQTQCTRLRSEGETAFFLELATLAQIPFRDLLSAEEDAEFEAWLKSANKPATFFVDSIDELQLTSGSLAAALNKLGKALAGHLGRAHIVVTTRPVPFDEDCVRQRLPVPLPSTAISKADAFADVAMGEGKKEDKKTSDQAPPTWRTVALMPLTDEQILEFATTQGVTDPQAMLDDISKRNAQDFARRPQDLVELCADWKTHHRIRTHREQVQSNISIKLLPATGRNEPGELSQEKAISGASRLALAALLTRRLTFRHSAADDDVDSEAALDPADILSDWTPAERKTLLERPLFGFASYGRVRFHHRSVIEFLAAQQLETYLQRGMSIRSIKRILFTQTDGNTVLRPSLRPVAGWLAAKVPDLFTKLMELEPSVLLNMGDPQTLSELQRIRALEAYVRAYGPGGWRGLQVPAIQAHRFASPGLSKTINTLWNAGIENPDTREVLLELIEAGRLKDCALIARRAAMDTNATISERLDALRALIAIEDEALVAICEGMGSGVDVWPDKLIRYALSLLFPEHLTVEQLATILARAEDTASRSLDELSWHLPHRVESADLDLGTLRALRDALVDLIRSSLLWRKKEWPRLHSRFAHLTKLLAATCNRGLSEEVTPDWLGAALLSVRLPLRQDRNDGPIATLQSTLAELSAETSETLFWMDDAFLRTMRTPQTNWRQIYAMLRDDGPITLKPDRDTAWILATIGDAAETMQRRSLALEVALNFMPFGNRRAHAIDMMAHVTDSLELTLRVADWSVLPKASRDHLEWEAKDKLRREERERKTQEDRESWKALLHEIEQTPEIAFAEDQAETTAWNLSRVMGHSLGSARRHGWNAAFLAEHFDAATIAKIRSAFQTAWRTIKPTVPSERTDETRGLYYSNWSFGLSGLYAEAENPSWTQNLSTEEAELAARYAYIAMNGFPNWLDDLADRHSDALDAVLGRELDLQLAGAYSAKGHSSLIQDIRYAKMPIGQLFTDRILAALELASRNPLALTTAIESDSVVFQACEIIIEHGTDDDRRRFRQIIDRYLAVDLPDDARLNWTRYLFVLSPEDGVTAVIDRLSDLEPAKETNATRWFARLFGDRGDAVNLSDARFTPEQLMPLLELAYQHVRPCDDTVRESGSYTPDARDHAEQARNALLSAVLDYPGEAGLKAKMALSHAPYCAHFKDRIRAIARERRALEADADVYAPQQVARLHAQAEPQISSNAAMHALLEDRIEQLEELLLSDTSPREGWCLFEKETLLRRAIGRAIQDRANGTYCVDMEAVTADEKETDIRLRAVQTEIEGVIEVKRADAHSGRVLFATLQDQLVDRYLAPDTRKAGVLLLTLSSDKQWERPDTGELMDLPTLLTWLRAEALRLETASGGELMLSVQCLDLRPRLPEAKRTAKLRPMPA